MAKKTTIESVTNKFVQALADMIRRESLRIASDMLGTPVKTIAQAQKASAKMGTRKPAKAKATSKAKATAKKTKVKAKTAKAAAPAKKPQKRAKAKVKTDFEKSITEPTTDEMSTPTSELNGMTEMSTDDESVVAA